MGFLESLTLLFVGLKLLDVIDWSWWWVFAPMYVYVVLIGTWLLMAIVFGILDGVAKARRKQRINKRK